MPLSRSAESRFQRWAIRAIAAFLVVYMLGAFGIPTFVPYVAVLIAVVVDGVRTIVQGRPPTFPRARTSDGETIH